MSDTVPRPDHHPETMTREELPLVADYLQASFGQQVARQALAVWFEEFSRFTQADALEALRALRRRARFPSVAEFVEAAATARDRRVEAERPLELEAPPAPVEVRRYEIARARTLLAAAGARVAARSMVHESRAVEEPPPPTAPPAHLPGVEL